MNIDERIEAHIAVALAQLPISERVDAAIKKAVREAEERICQRVFDALMEAADPALRELINPDAEYVRVFVAQAQSSAKIDDLLESVVARWDWDEVIEERVWQIAAPALEARIDERIKARWSSANQAQPGAAWIDHGKVGPSCDDTHKFECSVCGAIAHEKWEPGPCGHGQAPDKTTDPRSG